ncbi:MAG: L-2-amino-thiazoline-4-carboxylic acid hydrolase [Rhodospirillales bacterium]|nr:L-2-amino-thiazoline-4-carboxylic acid hydrolase [Rhodospirillales bacterium]
MTTLNRLPILERRRIQAEVIKPIYESLKTEVGEETAKRIIGKAIIEAAIDEGKRFAADHGSSGGIDGFASFQHLWDADGALESEVTKHTEDEYVYKVTRCRYAEMYHAMGVGEIGFQLSCNRDATFVEGYDPRIKLTRTQTIMQGADYCDFHYRMTGEDS